MRKSGIIFVIFFLLACVSCRKSYVTLSGYAQGGQYAVKYNPEGVSLSPEQMQAAVDSILYEIDTTLSGYNPDSQLSRLSRGEKFVPSPMFCGIYERSRQYCEQSGGALDVGSAPLFDIWGFGFKSGSLPSDELVKETLSDIGILRLPATLEEAMAQKDSVKLNFNAVAQGFSCDYVASFLRSKGVKDMLVDIGEIYCQGVNAKGEGWQIGVDKPEDGNNTPGKDITAYFDSKGKPCGIVTSGNYRKFYVKDGKKYSHTIDPRNGYPVEHQLLSATIIAPTAEEADAASTWCMVIGPEEARELVISRGYGACLISADSIWTYNWD